MDRRYRYRCYKTFKNFWAVAKARCTAVVKSHLCGRSLAFHQLLKTVKEVGNDGVRDQKTVGIAQP